MTALFDSPLYRAAIFTDPEVVAHPETGSEREAEIAVLDFPGDAVSAPWHVILFNDEVHAFDEVVLQVMKATGCGMREAAEITLKAHHTGQAGVHSGEMESCLRVQRVLQEIALITELRG